MAKEITRRALALVFTNSLGKDVTLTISDPAPADSIDDSFISSKMDAIINSQALGSDSLVKTKKEAKFIIQEEEELSL